MSPPPDASWSSTSSLEQLMLLETDSNNHSCITIVLSVASNPSIDWLCANVLPKLLRHPRFCSRPVRTPSKGYRYHALPEFTDPASPAVRSLIHEPPLIPTDLPFLDRYNLFTRQLNEIISTRIPFDLPMWRIYVFRQFSIARQQTHQLHDCSTILFKVHHAIADGIGLVKYFSSQMIDNPSQNPNKMLVVPQRMRHKQQAALRTTTTAPSDSVIPHKSTSWFNNMCNILNDCFQVMVKPLVPDPDSVFTRTPIQSEKVCAIIPPSTFSVQQFKHTSLRLGITINDLLYAAVSGATAAYMEEHGDAVSKLSGVRCGIPVNRHMLDEFDMSDVSNQLAILPVRLHIDAESRADRLQKCVQTMRELKRGVRPQVSIAVLKIVTVMPMVLRRPLWKHLTRCSSLLLTNVPGPRERVTVSGVEVEGMHFFAPGDGHSGVVVCLFSYAGSVCMGVQADRDRVSNPRRYMELLQTEVEALLEMRPESLQEGLQE